ncbi:hypothetical protein RB594_008001 [Gaeumannomyces avenae]
MKFSVIAAAASLVAVGSCGKAIVKNNCDATVFVQSFPFSGGQGAQTALKKGDTWSEDMIAAGSTVKIAKTRTLSDPLFFGYSSSKNPDYAYYEFSTEWGNPFAGNRNILSPGDGCEQFDCAANQADCYSTPVHKKVFGCPEPVDVTATLCA